MTWTSWVISAARVISAATWTAAASLVMLAIALVTWAAFLAHRSEDHWFAVLLVAVLVLGVGVTFARQAFHGVRATPANR